mgnify:CR=1 FL=1
MRHARHHRRIGARLPFAAMLAVLGFGQLRAADEPAAVPLAPRSGPRAATMFVPLAPAQTGIVTENNYADPKMWAEHYQELAYGAMGTGLAAGDFDNDGRPDLFVVSKTGRSRLFRNLGNWKFADVTEKAGLLRDPEARAAPAMKESEAWKQGAAWADVNNDGWLDLYVCRWGAPNLLYINQRDGTFREEAAARGLTSLFFLYTEQAVAIILIATSGDGLAVLVMLIDL